MSNVQIDMNTSMRRIYDPAVHDTDSDLLPPELNAVAEGGFVVTDGGRLFLAAPEHKSSPPDGSDDWDAEWFVNKIRLDSAKPASDPHWRSELLGYGLQLARRLLLAARALTSLPVQAVVSLQSAESEADPDIDFATGTLHVYVIRSPDNDLARTIAGFTQPAITLTSAV